GRGGDLDVVCGGGDLGDGCAAVGRVSHAVEAGLADGSEIIFGGSDNLVRACSGGGDGGCALGIECLWLAIDGDAGADVAGAAVGE
ncbi:hypothetical protein, partial [Undibacterium sp. Tian12W]|uniref:hypothetical protein n=1 Tax=Undibacterium sp. Tian12W TaxID=3413054 RepID=UPI003BF10E67